MRAQGRHSAREASAAGRTVLITDCDHGSVDLEHEVLAAAGLDVRLAQCRTEDDVLREAGDAVGLIVQYAPITERVLAGLPAVRVVSRYGVGVDTIDVPAATRHGVWVANVPDYAVEEVSDHALALALSLLRGVALLDRSVRAGHWDYTTGGELRRLSTRTVGVVGCGRIGRATAAKAAALGLRVLAHDPAVAVDPPVGHVTLHELLAEADVVSLHAPLTDATRGLIGRDALARMRPSAFLVNTARGGLVDADALLEALDTERLAGAGLDVLPDEPPTGASARLATHPKVVCTPHAAWYSREAFEMLKREAAREVVRVLEEGRPRSPVNEPEEAAVRA